MNDQLSAPALTPAQEAILKHARDFGHAYAGLYGRNRGGGSRRATVKKLTIVGFLTSCQPFKLTAAGLQALEQHEHRQIKRVKPSEPSA